MPGTAKMETNTKRRLDDSLVGILKKKKKGVNKERKSRLPRGKKIIPGKVVILKGDGNIHDLQPTNSGTSSTSTI